MSDDWARDDVLLFLAASAARQAFDEAQYNNRVNAYISRGFSSEQAQTVVNTWYQAYRPPRWSTGLWWTLLVGWALFCLAVLVFPSGPRTFGGFAFGLGSCGLLYWRVEYCTAANLRSERCAAQARDWLNERGL